MRRGATKYLGSYAVSRPVEDFGRSSQPTFQNRARAVSRSNGAQAWKNLQDCTSVMRLPATVTASPLMRGERTRAPVSDGSGRAG